MQKIIDDGDDVVDVVDDDDDDGGGGDSGMNHWLVNCRGLQIHLACHGECWLQFVCAVLMDFGMYKLLGGQVAFPFHVVASVEVLKKSYATISHYKCCCIEPGAAG